MKRLFLLLPLVALAGCKDPQDGVKVVISYGQFVPGCVRVTATDDASGDTRTTDVAVRGKKPEPNSQIVVGVLLPEKWGTAITVEANGYEALPKDDACVGNAVTNQRKGLSVPKGSTKDGKPAELTLLADARDEDGDGYVSNTAGGSDCDDKAGVGAGINPGATELCNGQDDNCDGNKDEDFAIGSECISPEGCPSVRTCNTSDPTTFACIATNVQYAWVDADRDQHGDKNQGQVVVCSATLPPDRLPLTSPHDDCNDSEASIHPQATEKCNTVDDDCDGDTDEGFGVGATCFETGVQCDGIQQCNATQDGVVCKPTGTVPTWYPDQDEDQHGKMDAGIVRCPKPDAGYITEGRDCDDGNPFIHGDARELCDGQDNNCNGTVDDGLNCAPTWAGQQVGEEADRTWYGLSVYGDGGVWIVGSDGGRAVKQPSETAFSVRPGACTGTSNTRTLFGVWSNSEGKAFIGGSEGLLLIQEPGSTDCTPRRPPNLDAGSGTIATTDLFGFANPSDPDDVQLYGVASDDDKGATFQWNGAVVGVPIIAASNSTFQGIHGISPEVMFAVGSFKNPEAGGARGQIFRYDPVTSSWGTPVEPPNTKGLNAVWVVNSKLAYAVGNAGAFLKWDGSVWATSPGPAAERLTGVIAFGSNSVYVTSEAGKVYRYENGNWQTYDLGASLYGINGTNPGDLWVIGVRGLAFHYPSWPAAPPPP
ncbi:hypothetical protein D7X55_18965 [Corallococcus sp. AB049A]|uniref:putative metal-binding motif-containing protein n=1 Tax=Corallococcus sp. AB049A TaxID=2316721 RepID=UPI000ED4B6CF|nr:putative metal-binding motif-containing protein [Corallococcus sp. AB049A]RKI63911.1 hypothetical protein D7X55_18965 [Corallococcus sp. AB049A]